jgi:uncharacterized protein (DUF3820 family)
MTSSLEFNDTSPMPWGKYTGTKMANVPSSYLLWLYDNKKCSGKILRYILDNMDVLRNDVKNNTKD